MALSAVCTLSMNWWRDMGLCMEAAGGGAGAACGGGALGGAAGAAGGAATAAGVPLDEQPASATVTTAAAMNPQYCPFLSIDLIPFVFQCSKPAHRCLPEREYHTLGAATNLGRSLPRLGGCHPKPMPKRRLDLNPWSHSCASLGHRRRLSRLRDQRSRTHRPGAECLHRTSAGEDFGCPRGRGHTYHARGQLWIRHWLLDGKTDSWTDRNRLSRLGSAPKACTVNAGRAKQRGLGTTARPQSSVCAATLASTPPHRLAEE